MRLAGGSDDVANACYTPLRLLAAIVKAIGEILGLMQNAADALVHNAM